MLGVDASALSLTDAVHQRWQTSPVPAAQEELAHLSRGDRWRRFIPNEPQVQYTNSDDRTAESLGLQLVVPLPPKPFAMMSLDRARAKVQGAELVARRQELAREAIQAYLDCATARAAVHQQEVSIVDNETLARSLRARYEAGTATQAENIGMELQLRQQRADLEVTRDHSTIACAKLRDLLALSPSDTVTEPPKDLDDALIRELGEDTADEARAKAALDLAQATESAAWWQQVPDLTLGATRNRYDYLPGSPSGKELTWTFMASITIPLLFPFHESVEASRASHQATLDRGAAETLMINARSDREDAAREYQRDRRRLAELTAKDLPMALALRESTFSAYRTGKLGFAELVFARKTLSDLQGQELQLRGALINARLRCLARCQVEKKDTAS